MIKNYKLSLVVSIVSCSLLNAMDNNILSNAIHPNANVVVILKSKEYTNIDLLCLYQGFTDMKSWFYQNQNFNYVISDQGFSKFKKDWWNRDVYFRSEYKEVSEKFRKENGRYPSGTAEETKVLYNYRVQNKKIFEEKWNKIEEKQKQIDEEIKRVVGTEKYEEVMLNYKLCFLMFTNISYEQVFELRSINGVAKVGNFNNFNINMLKQFRETKDPKKLDQIFNQRIDISRNIINRSCK